MSTFLSDDLKQGIKSARRVAQARKTRMTVRADERRIPILRFLDRGFAVEGDAAAHLRGFVDIYEGERHKLRCLIVASEEEDGEILYEFKRSTATADGAALDFAKATDAPVGLIGKA